MYGPPIGLFWDGPRTYRADPSKSTAAEKTQVHSEVFVAETWTKNVFERMDKSAAFVQPAISYGTVASSLEHRTMRSLRALVGRLCAREEPPTMGHKIFGREGLWLV